MINIYVLAKMQSFCTLKCNYRPFNNLNFNIHKLWTFNLNISLYSSCLFAIFLCRLLQRIPRGCGRSEANWSQHFSGEEDKEEEGWREVGFEQDNSGGAGLSHSRACCWFQGKFERLIFKLVFAVHVCCVVKYFSCTSCIRKINKK